jgi:hypothetical protein
MALVSRRPLHKKSVVRIYVLLLMTVQTAAGNAVSDRKAYFVTDY